LWIAIENIAELRLRSCSRRFGCCVSKRSERGAGRILVGTASWSDPAFVEHWYPKKMRASDRLGWYAQQFEMVEVNSTFYSVPEPRLVERWCRNTPDRFTFDVKLHQVLSRHSTPAKYLLPNLRRRVELDEKAKIRLTPDLEEAVVDSFRPSLSIFRDAGKLGALLLQLSPAFSPRKHRLADLDSLVDLLRDYSLAIELRNRNWMVGDQSESTIDFFRMRNISFVNVDAPASDHFTIMPSDRNEITNPRLAYLRLHGRNAHAYITGRSVAARFNYDYSDGEIDEVAQRSRQLACEADEVHVVFNNNNLDYAPRAAIWLRKALGQKVAAPSPQTPELF
jgi:uncharacterized protein YecE (DUF72 family)